MSAIIDDVPTHQARMVMANVATDEEELNDEADEFFGPPRRFLRRRSFTSCSRNRAMYWPSLEWSLVAASPGEISPFLGSSFGCVSTESLPLSPQTAE